MLLWIFSMLSPSLQTGDLFEYHLRNFLNFSEGQCSDFYRHVCPPSMMENDTIMYKNEQFYRDIEEQQKAFTLTNPIANDIMDAWKDASCTFDRQYYKNLSINRCAEDWDCYHKDFQYFFSVFSQLASEVPENLAFYAKHSNKTNRNITLAPEVTATMVEKIVEKIEFNVSANYFQSLQNRLAVMEFLNVNETLFDTSVTFLTKLFDEYKVNVLNNLRRTTWLAEMQQFQLDILTQFEFFLDDLKLVTDFDQYDRNLTFVRSVNKQFSSHYYEGIKRSTGCLWIDVAIALESCRIMLRKEATTNQLLDLLTRIKSSFNFKSFNIHRSVIMTAPTFFPLTQDTSEQAMIASTGRVLAQEIYRTFIDSEYTRAHPFFVSESHCVMDHFYDTCVKFGGGPTCDNGRRTFVDDASNLEGMREAHALLSQRYSVGQLASLAFPDLPYTVEQTFFYAFASLACDANLQDEQYGNRSQSAANIVVNGILSQMPEFTKAFNCFEGEPMSASEQDICYLFGENAIGRYSDSINSTVFKSSRWVTSSLSNGKIEDDLDRLLDFLESS